MTSDSPSDAVLTVDLDALADNYRLLAAKAAPAECAAVVKADGYGLGAATVAPALAAAGATSFFVAQLGEAIALRALLPAVDIGVLNGLAPDRETDYATQRLAPVLNTLGEVADWAAFCRARGHAPAAYLHIDTGMNRLGLGPDELATLAGEPDRLSGIGLRAYMSHLACADQAGAALTARQLADFQTALARLPRGRASLANSSGIFRGAAYHLDLVRPGCALYGINPTPETANPMRRVVGLAARVLQVRAVDSPMTVGYGATHRVRQEAKIATIAMGYADGYLRSLNDRGRVWFAGRQAPVVGRVSMDLITVDVSDLPDGAVVPGSMAEIIGDHQSADDVAAQAGTIGYEILTALGRRYARRTVGGGA